MSGYEARDLDTGQVVPDTGPQRAYGTPTSRYGAFTLPPILAASPTELHIPPPHAPHVRIVHVPVKPQVSAGWYLFALLMTALGLIGFISLVIYTTH